MSLMDLFNNITRGEYKPISNRYSSELADLIKRMIVVDPNRRLSSGEVLQIAE
jgi:serine/threonine protein kinase